MPEAPEPSYAHVDLTVVDPDEVVLGVDTHKDVHVAAVINVLGVNSPATISAGSPSQPS